MTIHIFPGKMLVIVYRPVLVNGNCGSPEPREMVRTVRQILQRCHLTGNRNQWYQQALDRRESIIPQ